MAQPYWVHDLAGPGNEHIADVKVDADGSTYLVGEFGGTISFAGQSYASSGSIDFFVAKLNAAGGLVWFKQGGGPGIDRALKLALGSNDVLAITGEFLGSATFQGQPMTSVGGTADMFLAQLDKATGTLIWLRQGGGGAGTDRPGGVSIAADGSICVAGEFRGSATWDGQGLTSMLNPDTGLPSADVFLAKWSAAGAVQWVRSGTAKYDDRAVDVVHDNAGNIFVTGQFSDTITFDAVYDNALLNASFLVKYDSDGHEEWFRRFGGAGFNHVRDMVVGPDGRLLLVGDVQGTMVWSGPPVVSMPAGFTDAYYLLAVSTAGALLDHETMGSAEGVGVNALSVWNDDIAVLGWFQCQFSGLAQHYGANGIFMATGTEDLFVARHSASDLSLNEAQQVGGRSAKSPGAVAHTAPGQVIFTGSFQQSLIFPGGPGFTVDPGTAIPSVLGNGVSQYCSDSNYGSFTGVQSAGLTDGFIARGYWEGREPYDWWLRSGSGCERDTLQPCIRRGGEPVCPDTITACGAAGLNVFTRYSHVVGNTLGYLGPALTYQWSNGSTAANINAGQTGWYGVTISTVNGCWQWTDSVYVVVLPLPPAPMVSDDVVVNTSTSSPALIEMCHPETHWVWGTNNDLVQSVQWSTPDGLVIMGDSVQVDTSGYYNITYTGANGCTRTTAVQVLDHPAPVMPDLDLDLSILFTQDLDLNDSVTVCPGGNVSYVWTPTWTVDGEVGADLPPGLTVLWNLLPGEPTIVASDGAQSGSLPGIGPAWQRVELIIRVVNAPCGDDTLDFTGLDSIFVDLHRALAVDVSLTGPSILCDGDTTVLVAQCTGCDEMIWSAGTGQFISPDSLQIFQGGTYSVTGSVTDTTGCSFSDQASIAVSVPTGPVLEVNPSNGIICPGGSATMSTTLTGDDPVWYGPQGPVTGQGTSYTTASAGEYYLTMLVGGCLVTSNNVALAAYGTPYLDVQPLAALCHPGDEVQITVLTVPGSNVQWAAPIGGSALSVSIDQPGVYSCTVEACGIQTPLSVEVTAAPATAQLATSGPFVLCEGDSVFLSAQPGNADYTWLPGNLTGMQVQVWEPGDYQVVVTNDAGCTDTSAVVQVTQVSFGGPLTIAGDTVCLGSSVTLLAAGPGPVQWYGGPDFTNPLGSGAALTFTPTASLVVLARQENAGCFGDSSSAFVLVKPVPGPITIAGPNALCAGEELVLTAQAPDSVSLAWTTPAGNFGGTPLQIAAVAIGNSGTYFCQPVYEGCAGPSATHLLVVNAAIPPGLPADTTICQGGAVAIALAPGYSGVLWSNGSTANQFFIAQAVSLSLVAIDPNGCPVSDAIVVEVVACPLDVPNVFTPNGDGINDAWLLGPGGYTAATADVYNRWGGLVWSGDMITKGFKGEYMQTGELLSEGTYFYVLQLSFGTGGGKGVSGHLTLLR